MEREMGFFRRKIGMEKEEKNKLKNKKGCMQVWKTDVWEVMTDKAMGDGLPHRDDECGLKEKCQKAYHDENGFMKGFCVGKIIMTCMIKTQLLKVVTITCFSNFLWFMKITSTAKCDHLWNLKNVSTNRARKLCERIIKHKMQE